MIVFERPQHTAKKALKVVSICFFALVLAGWYFFPGGQQANRPTAFEARASDASAQHLLPETAYPLRNWSVENLQIDSPAGISVQVGSGPDKVLFNKNETKKLPIASLTKLMTALVVLERYNVTQVHDLLFSMLIESSNQA